MTYYLSGSCTQGIEGHQLRPNLVTWHGTRSEVPAAAHKGFQYWDCRYTDNQNHHKYPSPGGFISLEKCAITHCSDKTRQRLVGPTLGTFLSVVHLSAMDKTLELTQTPWKPPTNLYESTISSMDPWVL
jgi:hypothetical protein